MSTDTSCRQRLMTLSQIDFSRCVAVNDALNILVSCYAKSFILYNCLWFVLCLLICMGYMSCHNSLFYRLVKPCSLNILMYSVVVHASSNVCLQPELFLFKSTCGYLHECDLCLFQDLSTCKTEGPSYRQLPKSYVHPICSGRNELCDEVWLN